MDALVRQPVLFAVQITLRLERPSVTLFIDRLPLHVWNDHARTPPIQFWSVRVPVLLTESGLIAPPASETPQDWVFDTGNTGDAFAWRHHLVAAGLDPNVGRAGSRAISSTLGVPKQLVPVRSADLWLVSNVPALASTPFKLELDPGIAFRDVPALPDPQLQRPLLGMRAVRRARLRIEMDFATDTVS